MTKPVWCELVCAGCASTTAGRFTYGAIPRREMEKEAKRRKWVFDRDWLCRECVERRAHKAATA